MFSFSLDEIFAFKLPYILPLALYIIKLVFRLF